MAVLYYWVRANYVVDLADVVHSGMALQQNSPTFRALSPGDRVWAITRNSDSEYVLAGQCATQAVIEDGSGRYGRYLMEPVAGSTILYDVDASPSAESLLRSLSIRINAAALGQSFQGPAAVRKISEEDDAAIVKFATHLPRLSRTGPAHKPSGLSLEDLQKLAEYRGVETATVGRDELIRILEGLPDPKKLSPRSQFSGKRIKRAREWQDGSNPRRPGGHGYNAFELIPPGELGIRADDLLARMATLPIKSSKEYGAGGTNHLTWDLDRGFTELIDDIDPPASFQLGTIVPRRSEKSSNHTELGSKAIKLNAEGLEKLRENFLNRLPGFVDFHTPNGPYQVLERRYKDDLRAKIKAELHAGIFASDEPQLAKATVHSVLRMLTEPLRETGHTQALVGASDVEFIRSLSEADTVAFARALGALIHGPGSPAIRAQLFVVQMLPIWERTVQGSVYSLSRSLPSAFLMLCDPENSIAIRTRVINRAARMLCGVVPFAREPLHAEQYEFTMRLAREVQTELQRWSWRPRDMIDVHGFMWVGARGKYYSIDADGPLLDGHD